MTSTIKLPDPLADGIYFGLPEDIYHGDLALGSSNIRDLLKGANEYWQKSPLNPRRKKEKVTPAKIMGKAIHKLLLEGHGPFEANFIRGPYSDDDDDLSPADKSKLTKEAKANLLSHQELLKRDDYDFITEIREIIDADPHLKGSLDGGPSEVSVFWTRKDGTRLKCRFDKLKLGGWGDLKSIANEMGREIGAACCWDIYRFRYDMQIEHYNEGRRMIPALKDKLFVATQPLASMKLTPELKAMRAFIEELAGNDTFSTVMMFIPKTGAPDAWATHLLPSNDLLTKDARDDIETALMIYRDAVKKYGVKGARWLPDRYITELQRDDLPAGVNRRRV